MLLLIIPQPISQAVGIYENCQEVLRIVLQNENVFAANNLLLQFM